ncbi:MAG: HD-GYP domain-containing protein [Clostridia bacterium]|nr:HD-GYP domain-containing protein [Clostridia bacterium]
MAGVAVGKQKTHSITGKIGQRFRQVRERANQSRLRSVREQIVFLYFLILFIAVSVYLDRDSALPYRGESTSMQSGWVMADGEIQDIGKLPAGTLDLRRDLSGISLNGRSLCLRSIDTVFDVFAGDTRIYSYHPPIPKRLGASYGMYVHTIPIPEGTTTLELHLEPVFPEVPAALSDVVIEDGGAYMGRLFRRNLWALGFSMIILLVGIFFLIIGLFGKILMNTAGLDFVSFGILCILTGFAGFNDTVLLQVLTGHPSLIRVITYICLMFMPYPAMSFFAGATGQGRSVLVPVSLILGLANFAVQVLLTHTGISDYYYMVYISHGLIILTFAGIGYLLHRAIRRHTLQRELMQVLAVGLSACTVGAVVDIVRYYILQSHGSAGFTRVTVLIFTLIMGMYLFREQTRALRRKHEENATFIREITTAFARVIDMKDRNTNGHSFRVARYTAMLAEELGCDPETVDRYYRIALLHDVGKIGIPKAVLKKPGRLTEEEYRIIQSHTTKGYDLLKDISIMPELATGALYHHERPDGLGYPQHLKGNEIPRVAQIIAVADCFDSMYSDRPYRARMNYEKAVSIIREGAGTQLTADVVDAFLRLAEKGKFRAPDDHGGGTTENIDNIPAGHS